jgi:hypothetical protein
LQRRGRDRSESGLQLGDQDVHGRIIEGVGKGVMGVYAYDSKVLSTVAETPVKEMAPRIQQVADKATCIQRVSVADLAATFVKHVRAEPLLAGKSHREALTRTIVSNYCQK